ncbi:MAG: enoyl-CoA hydratase/isomerase family protein [Ignavibacteriaceae bacterium]|nr:enoyl-CoA hydratase/isomerase family protein [Ignavibacteriaceae bacterium]
MILFERKNNTGIITLNRPEKRNALHPKLVEQLKNKLTELSNDKTLSSIIITGSGKSFCAGADLAYLNNLQNYSSIENEKDSELLAELFLMIYNFPVPVIAAVNGSAIAGGCGLATVCDFIIADEKNAKFGYSEVKIGFVPAIVSIFLIKKIGEGKTKALMLSGEIIDAVRGERIGMVDILTDDVLKAGLALAARLEINSVQSMRMTKNMINLISGMSVETAVDYCVRLNAVSRSSEDFRNGLQKFLNK